MTNSKFTLIAVQDAAISSAEMTRTEFVPLFAPMAASAKKVTQDTWAAVFQSKIAKVNRKYE